jgi:hypothetical protein
MSVTFQFLHADSYKDLGVKLRSKLHLYCHVDYVHSQTVRTLGLIRCIIYNVSSSESYCLYNALVISKLEYVPVVRDNLTTDFKLESIQKNFSLCVIVLSPVS